jgi:hypothetical protein
MLAPNAGLVQHRTRQEAAGRAKVYEFWEWLIIRIPVVWRLSG